MNKGSNGIADRFQCNKCTNHGTLYLDKEAKEWLCEKCHFNKNKSKESNYYTEYR